MAQKSRLDDVAADERQVAIDLNAKASDTAALAFVA
jgi:hypothetical protein